MADPSVEESLHAEDFVTTNCSYCLTQIRVPLSHFDRNPSAVCFDAGVVGCYKRFISGR